jgi:hypothetical protein
MWQNSNIWDDSNKSKLHSQRNQEQTNSENACYHTVQNLVFPLAVLKRKEENI